MKKLLLITTIALSTIPTLESGIWRSIGQFMTKHQNKFMMAGFAGQAVNESLQDITLATQEVKIAALENTIHTLNLKQETKTWESALLPIILEATKTIAYLLYIHYKTHQNEQAINHKKYRFNIDDILKFTKNPASAILTLKKYGYTQEDFRIICTENFEKNNQGFIQLLQKQDPTRNLADIVNDIDAGLASVIVIN